ncbi:CDP-alcohol phosphatidyltransferase family protein [Jatrophihabitans sp. YIM 134969]
MQTAGSSSSVPGSGQRAPDGLGRVWTVPNAISLARLLGVPVFLWLLLGVRSGTGDVLAIVVLAVSGFTDWLDGVLARKLGQYSRLGELLDPSADRLYILATLVGLVVRDIIPWWLAAVIIGRDVLLGILLLVLRGYGVGPLPVNYLGKSATFALLYAFPFLLLGSYHDRDGATGVAAGIAWPIAWAFTIWGVALYVWAGVLYVVQVARTVRTVRAARAAAS